MQSEQTHAPPLNGVPMNPGRCGRCHQSLSVPCRCPGAPRPRGFAAMPAEQRKGIAHRFTSAEARAVGHLGGHAKKFNRLVRDWETDRRPTWVRAMESRGQQIEEQALSRPGIRAGLKDWRDQQPRVEADEYRHGKIGESR